MVDASIISSRVSGGEDRRQPPRQHRLAASGRPDEQHVVRPDRRDLERTLGERLAADVGEVEVVGADRRERGRRGRCRR
jgi:hypothetical protein